MSKKSSMRASVLVGVCLSPLVGSAVAIAQERSDAPAGLPDEVRGLYTEAVEAGEARYADYTPPEGPWRWCHSESYMGNPWRVTMNDELRRLVEGAIESGLVSDYLVSDSNGDTTQQISQLRTFIERDCDIITTIAGSSTALDGVIEESFGKGIAVVTTAGAVTTPDALNVMHNQNLWGYRMGKGIAEALPDGGRVLQVEGISGHPLVAQENAGFETAAAEAGNLQIARKVSGGWTASITKSAVLSALATSPQPIDAVWTTGSETRVIAEAFKQAARPLPLITGSISGDALGYWNENKDAFRFFGGSVSPYVAAHNAYRVGIRLLSGQKPRVGTIIAPIPTVGQDDLSAWLQPCMKPDSSSLFPPGRGARTRTPCSPPRTTAT